MESQMYEVLSQSNSDPEASAMENDPDAHCRFLMDDLESAFDAFSSGIIISRMVSDSVLRGTVTAISDEYDEKLALKERDIKDLCEELENCKMGLSFVGSGFPEVELMKKWCDELTVIKGQLGDILELFPSSELGAHIANTGANKKAAAGANSEQRIEEIFSGLLHLDDMKSEDLIGYFKEEITKMKREHDSLVEKKTEEVFGLKRELLKEKGSSNPLQSENLRKRISKLVAELEGVLLEKELKAANLSENRNNNLSLVSEQEAKISALERENERLRCAVAEKEKEFEANTLFHSNFGKDVLLESEVRKRVEGTVMREMVEEFESRIRGGISDLESRKDKEMCVEKEEKEKLKQMVDSLCKEIQEKDKSLLEFECKFMLLSSKFNLFIEQFNKIEEKVKEQDLYISNSNIKLNAISSELEQTLLKVRVYEDDFKRLKDDFDNVSGSFEKEKQEEIMESIMISVEKMLETVEWRLINNVDCCASRILLMKSQFEQLARGAKYLKHEKEWYKKTSETKTANLCTAEKEVDLLGDEVDVLTYLLEKVYGVLNHYSYVFQHYPGVIEVLKQVDNYMKGEPIKIVRPQGKSNGILTLKK